ncbi:hypothetical protein GCM10027569_71850 [Flindersiella endophytica]
MCDTIRAPICAAHISTRAPHGSVHGSKPVDDQGGQSKCPGARITDRMPRTPRNKADSEVIGPSDPCARIDPCSRAEEAIA